MRKKQKEEARQEELQAAGNQSWSSRTPEKEADEAEQKNTRGSGVDYDEYNMGLTEKLLCCVLAMGCLFVVGFVFYQNIILAGLLSLFGLKYPKIHKKKVIKKRKNRLLLQFKDMLYSLSSAVGAGNSVEKALSVTLQDLQQQYSDPNAFMIKELELMVTRLSMNRTVEEVINDFAERSHIEDIQTFGNIFEIAKRTGGNLIDIIRNTTQIIADKIETKTEIDTLIASQRMEQKVLTVMPVGLVFFMTKMAGDFMKPMFTSGIGRVIATVSLAIIIIGTLWSRKVADIEF